MMLSDNPDINLHQKFLSRLQSIIFDDELIYGQTKSGLKFLRRALSSQKQDVLFVGLRDSIGAAADLKELQTKL